MIKIDPETYLISGASYIASPNCDDRPAGDVDVLIIHCISLPPNEFGGPHIDQLFLNQLDGDEHPYFESIQDLRVSAHCLIRRDGSLIQYVPLNKRAWHAGQSSFCGRERCNDFSIGIELEGADDIPYEDAQYKTLQELTLEIQTVFPTIITENIVGHCDVAPGRKTDPGPAFEWNRYREGLS